ncbi:MAG: adenylate/guanylate cyclase domain-containing protein [Fimbriimonadaceae bacterium]|nr:adenylate/guanylate cyclase domain-containing protein [Fimbriimonadaceae bacterium]QYK56701.1 MAG: adenylate/guanylate cyclase domain-containing protein [Fimbriimonadaceae bacterium]
MRLSLRATLTLRTTLLLVGTLLVLGSVAFWRARVTVDDLSGRIVRQTAVLVDQRVTGLLGLAESQGRLIRGLVVESATQRRPSAGNFDSLARRMLDLMQAQPEFGAVQFTLESTGDRVQVVQRANGALVVEVVRRTAGGRYRTEEYSMFGRELRQTSGRLREALDVRGEPWYQLARDRGEQSWYGVHLRNDLADVKTPGLTCVTPVYDADNAFAGVVTVDFTITELSRFLQTIQVGETGLAFLVEAVPGREPRVVAHPDLNRLLVTEGGSQRLAKPSEFTDPVASATLARIGENGWATRADEVQRIVLRASGEPYIAGLLPVTGGGRPRLITCVAVRDRDFMSGVWQTGWALAVLAMGGVVVAVVFSLLLARSVSLPLQELSAETARIRSFDLEPRPLPTSRIKEIDWLAEGMEQMKTGLRSFEKLVPTDYARWLVESGQEAKLGGERRHLTVYFADIIGFTALSERMEPEALVEVLAEYLDVLSGEVLRLGGTVDKFNGDDVMAFWGAPKAATDHAYLACRAALQSRATISQLHSEWREQGIPRLRASFGIATGDVVVGNVGSRRRMNYTVIGDSVNLASRLQGLNKYYETEVLINEAAREEAGERIVTRLVDLVSVAGREQAVPVYELLALASSCAPETIALASRHNDAMRLYRIRHFAESVEAFDSVLRLRPDDGPAKILRARAHRFSKDPPSDDWNGSIEVRVK